MRHFNKPIISTPDFLESLSDEYNVQTKIDGWRLGIDTSNGVIKTFSKNGNVIKIPHELMRNIKEIIPSGSIIDCEYINESRIKAINKIHNLKLPLINAIVIIDNIKINGDSLASIYYEDRMSTKYMSNVFDTKLEDLSNLLVLNDKIIKFPFCHGSKSVEFFQQNKLIPISEGVIVKNSKSKLKSTWYKIKYRS